MKKAIKTLAVLVLGLAAFAVLFEACCDGLDKELNITQKNATQAILEPQEDNTTTLWTAAERAEHVKTTTATYGEMIGAACQLAGFSQEYTWTAIAISAVETGWWTAPAFLESNNWGGMIDNAAYGLNGYATKEEGLEDYIRTLKFYRDKLGLDTPEKMAEKYCPGDAWWLPTVLAVRAEVIGIEEAQR